MEIPMSPAATYRAAHIRKLMVLEKWKGSEPDRSEFCRLHSVETLSPGLWVTAAFLDGTVRKMRSEHIRDATMEEERRAGEMTPV